MHALRTRVHGPREGGATFLAQFATKDGVNLQLLTSTLGPVELWAFSTTSEDAYVRNMLYRKIGPKETRRVLARLFPAGSCAKLIEDRMGDVREKAEYADEEAKSGILDTLVKEIIEAYSKDPDVRSL